MRTPKNKIVSIHIENKIDENPDTSFLGEYSDNPNDYAIVNTGEHAGEFLKDIPEDEYPERSREYCFFNPPIENYEGTPEEEMRKYCLQDYDRMQSLNNGQWYFMGIIAKAKITIGDTIQTIHSGGLWGIESDSTEYIEQTEKDELHSLSEILKNMGFSVHAVRRAMKNIERKL